MHTNRGRGAEPRPARVAAAPLPAAPSDVMLVSGCPPAAAGEGPPVALAMAVATAGNSGPWLIGSVAGVGSPYDACMGGKEQERT